MRRTLIFIAAGLLVLLVGGALALPLLVDVNQYRDLIQTEAEKAIGRKVTLGEISLSILPTFGVGVAPLEVEDLVKAESVTVGARLWPLIFGGEIVVSKVVIDSPRIELARRADGSWSIADLAAGKTTAKEGGEAAPGRTVTLSKLKIADGVVHVRDESKAAAGPIEVGLDLEASMNMTPDRVQAEATGHLTKGKSSLRIDGSLDKRGEKMTVDVVIPSSAIQADDLSALLTATSGPLPFRFSSSDPIRLEARLKGDPMGGDLQVSGSVEVSDATFEHPSMKQPMREIEGKVKLDGDRLELSDFHGVIGASDVGGTLSIENFKAPKVSFALKSKKADFWELMSFVEGEDSSAPPASGGAGASGAGDLLAAVRAKGTLTIDEGSFGAVAFRDLDSTLSLDKKVVRLDPVSMTLYDGTMTGKASMSMAASPPVVSVTAKAEKIHVDPLLTAALDLKGMLSGALTGDLSITAAGDAVNPILASATGSGDVRIENGRVGALNVLGILSKASGLLGEKSLKTVSNKLATEGTDFTSITAALKVGGGRIGTRNLRLISPDIELTDDGMLDMLKGTLEVEGRVIFSEAISQAMVDEESRAVDVFWDPAIKRVSLPLKLAGPIDAPMPNIDWNVAGGRLARSKLGDLLRKKGLGDLLGEQQAGGPVKSERAPAPDPGKLIENGGGAGAAAGDPGALDVSIQKKEFSGNLLAPDLKIRGTLRGANITDASLEVLDGDGRRIHEASLMKQVRAFYATADPATAADIRFRVEVDGKQLIQSGRKLTFSVRLQDQAGHSLTRQWEVER